MNTEDHEVLLRIMLINKVTNHRPLNSPQHVWFRRWGRVREDGINMRGEIILNNGRPNLVFFTYLCMCTLFSSKLQISNK